MAESNQRKVVDPIVIDEEDPFAELTRIMGFDPRVSALALAKENQPKENLAASAKSAQPAAQPTAPKVVEAQLRAPEPEIPQAAAEDFGIDLEKELLGDFADFDQPHQEEPVAASYLRDIEPVEAPEAKALATEPVEAEPAQAEPVDAEPVAAKAQAIAPSPESFELRIEDEFEEAFAEALDSDASADTGNRAYAPKEAVEPESVPENDEAGSVLEHDEAGYDASAHADERDAVPSEHDHLVSEFDLDDLDLRDFSLDEEVGAGPVTQAEPAPVSENDAGDHQIAAQADEHDAAASADERPISEFDLDDLDLRDPSPDDAQIRASQAGACAVEAPAAAAVDPLADVDMDFTAAFDREFAADVEEVTGDKGGEVPSVAVADARVPVAPETASEETVAKAVDEFAADGDDFEISLEEELGALLAEKPAAIEPAIAASELTRFPSGSRWDALSSDDKGRSAASDSRPDAAAADYRRSFANPSLVARHANFQTPPAPVSYSQTPPAATSRPAEDDLDDLLDAMESGAMESGTMESDASAGSFSPAEAGPSPAAPHGQATFEPPVPASDRGSVRRPDDVAAASYTAQAFAGNIEEAPSDVDDGAVPDIETVDVPEAAIAVADDLDIPELVFEEEQPQSAAYDDIDADLSGGFGEAVVSEEPMNHTVRGIARPAERTDFDADFETLFQPATSKAGPDAGFQPAAVDYRYNVQSRDDDDLDFSEDAAASAGDRFVDFDFEKDVEQEIAPSLAARERPAPRRRGLLLASIVGGVAVLGGVGALAISFGNGGGASMPAIVKADNSPVKVKPDNPGGATVPNQDNKVYDAAKGASPASGNPVQQKLVTTSEEPIDVTSVAHADPLPGVGAEEDIIAKAEDRIDPAANADQDTHTTEGIVVAPRKVKTMVVRSDGTLVPREEPAAAQPPEAMAAAVPAAKQVADQPAVSANEETSALASQDQPPASKAVPVKTVTTKKVAAAEDQPADATDVPALPPAKPAAQKTAETKPAEPKPAEVKAEEVAAVNVEPTAIAAGAWSVQIASQPSAESAKSTYQDLAKRYASVIGGRGVNIVKADIAGKGTYWRVRVPAKSRDEAISLCTDYKSAGGNCFVSK